MDTADIKASIEQALVKDHLTPPQKSSNLLLSLALQFNSYLSGRSIQIPFSNRIQDIEKALVPGESFKQMGPQLLGFYHQAKTSQNLELIRIIETFYYTHFIESINSNESLTPETKRLIMKTALKLYRNQQTVTPFISFILKFFMITSPTSQPQQNHKELSLLLEQFNATLAQAATPIDRDNKQVFVTPEEVDDFTSSLYLYGIPKAPPSQTWKWISRGMIAVLFVGIVAVGKKLYDILHTGHETVTFIQGNGNNDKTLELVTQNVANIVVKEWGPVLSQGAKDGNETLKAAITQLFTKLFDTQSGRTLLIEIVAETCRVVMEVDDKNRHEGVKSYIQEAANLGLTLTPQQQLALFKHLHIDLTGERAIEKLSECLNRYPGLQPFIKDLLITYVQQSKLIQASMVDRALKDEKKGIIVKLMDRLGNIHAGITESMKTFRTVQNLTTFWTAVKLSRDKLKEKPLSEFELSELAELQKKFEGIQLVSEMVSLAIYWDKNSPVIQQSFASIKQQKKMEVDTFSELDGNIKNHFQHELSDPPTPEQIRTLKKYITNLRDFFTEIESVLIEKIPYPLSHVPITV